VGAAWQRPRPIFYVFLLSVAMLGDSANLVPVPQIFNGRHAAQIQGDFVVFLIGMRVNQLLRPDKWMPMGAAMPRMLRELAHNPQMGLLHSYLMVGWRSAMTVQYWRSFEQLHAYAHARDAAHLPVWAAFNRAARGNQAVGIWHETYLVRAGRYEAVYVDMPRWGLAAAGELVPAVGRMQSAKSRLAAEPDKEAV